ncbi:MAG: hypothetical protein QXI58_01285 [Candidatus Micrarchaeia archaeon]
MMKVGVKVTYKVNLEDVNDLFVQDFIQKIKEGSQDYSIDYIKDAIKGWVIDNLNNLEIENIEVDENELQEVITSEREGTV